MSLKIVFAHFIIYNPNWLVSETQQISRFYTNDAEKDTIIDDDEKFQLI